MRVGESLALEWTDVDLDRRRSAFATRMELVGHQDLTMTLRYSHLSPR